MKNLVITGASSGIGREIARTFFNQGWQVHLVARNQDRLKQVSEELGGAPFYSCDLTLAESVSDLCGQLKTIPIHALINNAGAYDPKAVQDSDDSNWSYHIECNLMSAVRLTRGLWPNLIKSQSAIVNISSTLALRPIANTSAYSAAKAALNNWTLSLAIEGAPHGIRANGICPGIVDTPIHGFHQAQDEANQKIYQEVQKLQPLGRIGQPSDITGLAYHLCTEQASWTTGTLINVDGGILLNS